MRKVLLISLFLVLAGFFGYTLISFVLPVEKTASLNTFEIKIDDDNSLAIKDTEDESINLYAVGDIMLDRGVEYNILKYGAGDYRYPFLKSADYLKKADITFANLESQISDKGKKIGTINSFRVDPKSMDGLKYAGFDIVSVANNHTFDYDIPALEDSFKRLKEAGIEYVGGGFNEEEAFSLKIMEVKNTRIGFLAFCAIGSQWWRPIGERSGIAFVSEKDIEEVKEKVKEARENADILIVSFHSGTEYETAPDAFQTYFYRSIIDSGADLLIGHHPHVIQPIEEYNGKWIAYSLGNFVFDQGFSVETMEGMLLKVSINNKKIESVDSVKFSMNEYFQPELTDN